MRGRAKASASLRPPVRRRCPSLARLKSTCLYRLSLYNDELLYIVVIWPAPASAVSGAEHPDLFSNDFYLFWRSRFLRRRSSRVPNSSSMPWSSASRNYYESDFTLVHKELVPTEPVQHDPLLNAPRLAPIALPTIAASAESQVLDNLEATQRRMHKRLQHIPAANIFIMKLTPISPPKTRSKRMPKANASPTVTGPTQRKTKTTKKATTKTPMTAKVPAAPIAHRQQELPRAPLLLQAAQPSQQKSPLQPQPQPIALSLPQLTYANLMAHRAALGMHQAAESAAATRKRKASNLDDDHIAKRAKTSGSVASAVQAQPLHSIELTRSYTGSTTSSSTLHTRSTTVGGSSSPSDDELFDEFIKPDTFF